MIHEKLSKHNINKRYAMGVQKRECQLVNFGNRAMTTRQRDVAINEKLLQSDVY